MNKVEQITTDILNSILGIFIFVVSLLAFYLPYEIRIIPQVQEHLDTVRIVCGVILIVAFLFLYGSSFTIFRGNWALIAAIGFIGVLIFSTKMNGGDMSSALGTYGLAGIFLVMNIAVFFKVNPKKYILLAFIILFIISMVNAYTVYHYWGVGMWEDYGNYRNVYYSLVGNFNGGIEYVLPMAICGSAYAHRYGKWLEIVNYAAMTVNLFMAFKCDSLTQEITFAAMLAFMIMGDIMMLSKGFAKVIRIICQPVILAAVDFALFVSIVVINKTNWVAAIGLDPDFHNRRHIWNMAMDWIRANPIWGSGQETVAAEAAKITGYAHSHCTYLEVAYKTGFVGSVCMVLMVAAAVVAIYRNRHDRTSYILTAMLFLFGLAAVDETYPMVYVLLCLGLVYYIAKCTNETGKVKVEAVKSKKIKIEPADTSASAAAEPSQHTSQPMSDRMKNDGSEDVNPKSGRMKNEGPGDVNPKSDRINAESSDNVKTKDDRTEVTSRETYDCSEDIDNTIHIDETVMLDAARLSQQADSSAEAPGSNYASPIDEKEPENDRQNTTADNDSALDPRSGGVYEGQRDELMEQLRDNIKAETNKIIEEDESTES